jgi:hypothetical protein
MSLDLYHRLSRVCFIDADAPNLGRGGSTLFCRRFVPAISQTRAK